MMQEMGFRQIKSAPCSPAKPLGISRTRSESFHVTHKVPVGDSPYVRAKNVQLVEKDPEKAIPLFWAAINAGDRVDSALKDMAIVMKQQNRTEEAIEAIKSLRVRCSDQSQESLDNILLDLFKKCGRLDDQIALLKHKLFLIHQGMAFNGRRTKTARSQGKKFQVSVQQEATRLLGNLGWALMQQSNYIEAEEAYRRALMIAPDNNKMCNLGICLMKQGRINEAKDTLRRVRPAVTHGPRGMDSHLKAYDRAQQMLKDLECEMMLRGGCDRVEQRRLFDSLFSASSVWQPQPCKEQSSKNLPSFTSSSRAEDGFPDENIYSANIMVINQVTKNLPRFPPAKVEDGFPDENINSTNIMLKNKAILEGLKGKKPMNALNVAAPPFYLENSANETLKRTRSGNVADEMRVVNSNKIGESSKTVAEEPEVKTRRRSTSPERKAELWDGLLPDSKDFEEAIIAAALDGSGNEAAEKMGGNGINKVPGMVLKKVVAKKRLQVFRDITLSLSPKA